MHIDCAGRGSEWWNFDCVSREERCKHAVPSMRENHHLEGDITGLGRGGALI